MRPDRRLVVDDDIFGADGREVALDLVVAECPEEACRNGDSGRGRDRVVTPVEVQEPDGSLFIADREPGRHPRALPPDHRPASRGGTVRGVGSLLELLRRDRPGVDAVREPAGVRHLVYRVDVLRPDVRRRIPRPAEEVLEEIGRQADVPCLDLRGVLGLGLALERVVREELRLLGLEPQAGADDRERDNCGRQEGPCPVYP